MQYFSHSTHSKYRGNSNIRHLKYSSAEFVPNKLPCSLCMGYVSMGYTTFGSSFLDAAWSIISNASAIMEPFFACLRPTNHTAALCSPIYRSISVSHSSSFLPTLSLTNQPHGLYQRPPQPQRMGSSYL
jgi:hypothetical protein